MRTFLFLLLMLSFAHPNFGQDVKLVLPFGHTERINSIAFSPNGKIMVTASDDRTAKIWEAKNGKLLYSLEGHSGKVYTAKVSTDSKSIVTAGDNSAKIWSVQTGKLLLTIEDKNCNCAILSAGFSPDAKTVITTSSTVKVWDVQTGKLLHSLVGHTDEVLNASFSPDGKRLVTASSDNTAIIWEASTGRLLHILKGHKGYVQNANFSPDGLKIITASKDNVPRIWDAQTGTLQQTLDGHIKTWWDYEPFYNAQFSPDGKKIVTASIIDETAKIWDAETGELLHNLKGHRYGVSSFSFSPDSKNVLATSAGRGQAGKIWDTETGELLNILKGLPKHSNGCYSADGTAIGVAGDVNASIYSTKLEQPIHTELSPQYESGLRSLSCSPDNQRIVITGDKNATVWDIKSGTLIHTLQVHHEPGCSCVFTNASFSSDGKYIVTTGTTVQLWDNGTGGLIRNLGGFQDIISRAIFSPDSKSIVVYAGNVAEIYDVKTGKLIRKFKNKQYDINDLYLSPDGKQLAISYGEGYELESSDLSTGTQVVVRTTYGNELKIWDLLSGKLISTFPENRILAFSPDSKSVLAATETTNGDTIYSQVTQYDLTSDEEIQISYELGEVIEAAFSNNGNLILACGDKVKLYRSSKDDNRFDGYFLLKQKGGPVSNTQTVCFSRDDKIILTTMNGFVNSFASRDGKLLQSFEAHDDVILGLTYTPDGKSVITFSKDNIVKIWNSSTVEGYIPVKGRLQFELKGNVKSIGTANFSPDGQSILTMERPAAGNRFRLETGSNGKDTLLYNDISNKVWNIQTGKWEHIFLSKGSDFVTDGPPFFSPRGNIILTSGGDFSAKIWDSKSGKLIHSLQDTTYYSDYMNARFSRDGQKVATIFSETIGEDFRTVGIVKIWDVKTGKLINSINSEKHVTSYNFSPDGKSAVITYPNGPAKIWDVETCKVSGNLIGTDSLGYGVDAKFSPSGTHIIVNLYNKNETKIWDVGTGKMIREVEGIGYYSSDGKVIVSHDRKTVKVRESQTGKLIHTLSGIKENINELFLSPDGRTIFTYSNDKNVKTWNSLSGKLINTFSLRGNFTDIHWDTKRILSTEYSTLILTDLESGKEIVSWVDIDSVDWIVTHPSGLFDASPGAMDKLYFVQGLDIIEFSQLKERYFEPGLWKKVMARESLRNVVGFKSIELPPDVEIGQVDDKGYLSIQLTNRGGGIGEVNLFVNGKEVIKDARDPNANPEAAALSLKVFVGNNKSIVKGQENFIGVKAWNAGHWVVSRGQLISYQSKEIEQYQPSIHILTCGVSDYTGNEIDLKYAAKDANDMSIALQLGAKKLFGAERSYVYNLTTAQSKEFYPTKTNILKALDKISLTAHPLDIFVVYFSGHGISYGGQDGDWYYLTQEAYTGSTTAYNDPAIRTQTTISSNELVELFKKVPAGKQVLILDACASGKVVDNLMVNKDIESSTLRALDRMRDRMGMHIITGCTADAVSYEASKYGQGVLTYSILEGIRGAALREDQFVDISKLFQYAQDRVPQLAEGIGGIQSPQVFSPQGSQSFDIGLLSEAEKKSIPIAKIRPVFIRSNFQDENEIEDVLGLGIAVDASLQDVSTKGTDAPIIFVDVKEYPDGCKLIGRYKNENGKIILKLRKKCGAEDKTYEMSGDNVDELKAEILKVL